METDFEINWTMRKEQRIQTIALNQLCSLARRVDVRKSGENCLRKQRYGGTLNSGCKDQSKSHDQNLMLQSIVSLIKNRDKNGL